MFLALLLYESSDLGSNWLMYRFGPKPVIRGLAIICAVSNRV